MEAGLFSALVRAAIASSRLFTSFSYCAARDFPRGLLRDNASAINGMGSPATGASTGSASAGSCSLQ
eukprot:3582985-Heterocapsa_arctica.AAC.1